jgi:hypothetical protein
VVRYRWCRRAAAAAAGGGEVGLTWASRLDRRAPEVDDFYNHTHISPIMLIILEGIELSEIITHASDVDSRQEQQRSKRPVVLCAPTRLFALAEWHLLKVKGDYTESWLLSLVSLQSLQMQRYFVCRDALVQTKPRSWCGATFLRHL